MKALDWVLLGVVVLAVFFAVRYIRRARKRGKCIGCAGNCAGCAGCPPKNKDTEEAHR